MRRVTKIAKFLSHFLLSIKIENGFGSTFKCHRASGGGLLHNLYTERGTLYSKNFRPERKSSPTPSVPREMLRFVFRVK